jgi:SAM-dependent methyltransferase
VSQQCGHSFQKILDRGTQLARSYVMADSRGLAVVDFLAAHLRPSKSARILDIGCGSGLISFALAGRYGTVFGVDREPDNVRIAAEGRAARSLQNLHLMRGDGFHLPFADASFDGIVVNGVLEWTGLNSGSESPEKRQRDFLKEVMRLLRPGGVLYLAIENRSAPTHLWRDPHTGRLLVGLMPRRLANWFSRLCYGAAFEVYIYTPAQLEKLIAGSGFTGIALFGPVPGYHYPFHYVPLGSTAETVSDIERMDVASICQKAQEVGMKLDGPGLKRKLTRRARLGAYKYLSRDLAVICKAPARSGG